MGVLAMANEHPSGDTGQSLGSFNTRFGPHRPPYIPCSNCGTEHHYDAAHGEYLGQCRECGAFLRRPTEAEHEKFTDFLVWNSRHLDAGMAQGADR